MKNLGEKKTLLGKEFELLIKELKDSGVKVNENFKEENNKKELTVTFIKKRRIQ